MGNEIKPPTTPELGTSDPTTTSPESQATAANDPQVNGETMPSVEQQLRQLELKAAEHYDAWLRAKAETDNVRKRADADIAQARKYAIESFSAELLAVKDALEAALGVQNTSLDNLKSGVELTLKQLNSVFEKFRIIEVNPLGEKFDPHRHQAIATVASDAAPNTVVSVMQKGYLLQDRVLRPAMVTVAKPKSEAGSAETDAFSA